MNTPGSQTAVSELDIGIRAGAGTAHYRPDHRRPRPRGVGRLDRIHPIARDVRHPRDVLGTGNAAVKADPATVRQHLDISGESELVVGARGVATMAELG